jgi:hypothetical protein
MPESTSVAIAEEVSKLKIRRHFKADWFYEYDATG